MKLTEITTLSKNKIEGFINSTGLTTVEEVQAIPDGDKRLRARGIGPMFIQAIRRIEVPPKLEGEYLFREIIKEIQSHKGFKEDGGFYNHYRHAKILAERFNISLKGDSKTDYLTGFNDGYKKALEILHNGE